jgi:hypothetical protein
MLGAGSSTAGAAPGAFSLLSGPGSLGGQGGTAGLLSGQSAPGFFGDLTTMDKFSLANMVLNQARGSQPKPVQMTPPRPPGQARPVTPLPGPVQVRPVAATSVLEQLRKMGAMGLY